MESEVARRRVALRAGGGGWNVIGRFRGRRQQVRAERGRLDVTGAAIARGRMPRVERGIGARVSRHGAGTGDHPQDQHRSEEHTSELQSRLHLVCRLLLEKKKTNY